MDALTRSYRDQTVRLRSATVRDLLKLWPALDWRDLERTYPAWFAGASALIARDRRRSAGLAAAYLKAHRLQAGVPGEVSVRLDTGAPVEQVAASLRVTTLVAIKKSTMAGKVAEMAMRDAFVTSSGAVTRIVSNGGRETLRASLVADQRTGWRRVGSGACDWCRQYLDGEVHYVEGYDFDAHDWCNCSVEPVYE